MSCKPCTVVTYTAVHMMIVQLISIGTCRLESEVSDVLGDKDYVTMEDLEKLQYTEQVN